ncbi:4-hydroxythreonine-4-phosphate dehydrogenase PdxA [Tepidamorphus gemmatus]
MGEPAGIGPELVGMAWRILRHDAQCRFVCLADPRFLHRRLRAAGIDVPIVEIDAVPEAGLRFADALPVLSLDSPVASGEPGRPDVADCPAVLEAIHTAVALVQDGACRALVTSPVQKETLYLSGFRFPGHTELLGQLAARRGGPAVAVMMLASAQLRVVPVTVHVPLADVPRLLTTDLIVSTGMIAATDLARRFAIPAPRLAVCGLNPHAGEGGQIGTEDRDVIVPAVDRLIAAGIAASGPHSADTLFHPVARTGYDAVLAMYHDQALIPIKTIAFDTAVNVTLGLPFVRTSPDHGTALQLAGTGKADPTSLICAIRMAAEMADRGG